MFFAILIVFAVLYFLFWPGAKAVLRSANADDHATISTGVGMARSIWLVAFGLFLGFSVIGGSYFTVDQTEMANVRRFGHRLYNDPLGPGMHFKIPLIDQVDRLRVTLNTIHIDPFQVSTIDNQQVTIAINYNYTIPPGAVNHVLYEVGQSGPESVHEQAVAVARDRAGFIFSGQNMVTVNANRAAIQEAITNAVHERLKSLFGIEPHSLQIPSITPSPAFLESNERAVRAKNDAVAAENTKRTIQFQADQAVIKAKGEADSAIESARGQAESTRLNAEAERDQRLAQAKGFQAQVQAFGSSEKYVEWVKWSRWDGALPVYSTGAGGMTAVLPLTEPGRREPKVGKVTPQTPEAEQQNSAVPESVFPSRIPGWHSGYVGGQVVDQTPYRN